MTPKDLRHMLDLVKDEYIEEAADYRPAQRTRPVCHWQRWTALAACLCIAILGGLLILRNAGLPSSGLSQDSSESANCSEDTIAPEAAESAAIGQSETYDDCADGEPTENQTSGNSSDNTSDFPSRAEVAAQTLNSLFADASWFHEAYADGESCIVVLTEDNEGNRETVLDNCTAPEIVIFKNDLPE